MISRQPFSKKDLLSYLDEIELIAQQAGKQLLTYQKKLSSLTVDYKQAQGVVSEADVNVENFIVKKLTKLLPQASVLAEEASFGLSSSNVGSEDLLWVIDPLDGTTNFLNNMDYYGVCIALCFQGKPILGLVHRPRTNETYRAALNLGSYYRRDKSRLRKLRSVKTGDKKLKDCLLATGFATEKGVPFDQEFSLFKMMMKKSRGVRRMGSAALDLCLLAEGTFDGFWERGLAPWDVAAAGLICQEAGLIVTSYEMKPFVPFDKTIVAGKKKNHQQLIKVINS